MQTLAEYSIVAPAASGLPPAQDAGDSCYPHDVAYAMRATTIKVSYGLTQRTVGQAAAGEQFAIIGSRLYGAECWVETSSGWLFGVYLRNTADPPLASEAAPSPAAQYDDDGCYPHEVAYATRDTTIKESYGFAQRPVGQAAAGKQFAIIGSRLYGAVCWVETGEGWLFSNYLSTAPPTDPIPEEPVTVPAGCYDAEFAYVTGPMNIRASDSTDSKKVGTAANGDVFEVSASAQGETYCWLKVPEGWVAQTALVRSTIPRANLPRINGSPRFIDRIEGAYEYLSRRAPKWYLYLTKPTGVTIPPSLFEDYSSATAWDRSIEIAEGHISPVLTLASVLVHEVCHMYQFDHAEKRRWYRSEQEEECFDIQIEMIREIYPQSRFIPWLRELKREQGTPGF